MTFLICFLLFSLLYSLDSARMCLEQTNLICDLIKVVQNTNMHKECYSITFTEKIKLEKDFRSLRLLFLQHDKLGGAEWRF